MRIHDAQRRVWTVEKVGKAQMSNGVQFGVYEPSLTTTPGRHDRVSAYITGRLVANCSWDSAKSQVGLKFRNHQSGKQLLLSPFINFTPTTSIQHSAIVLSFTFFNAVVGIWFLIGSMKVIIQRSRSDTCAVCFKFTCVLRNYGRWRRTESFVT